MSSSSASREPVKRASAEQISTAAIDDALRLLAFDHSFQAHLISTVKSGQIIVVNDAACKLFGYSRKELLTRSRVDIFDQHEQSFQLMLEERTEQGHSVADVMIIRKGGKKIPCRIVSAVFEDTHGVQQSISSIEDLREPLRKQRYIDQYKEKIVTDNIASALAKADALLSESKEVQRELLFMSAAVSFDVIWDWNLLTGELYLSERFEELFGHPITNATGSINWWADHIHPEDKVAVEQGLQDAIQGSSSSWEFSYRFIRADGTVAFVFDRASILRDGEGKACRLIGAMQDTSRERELEQLLETEITNNSKLLAEYKQHIRLLFNFSSDLLYDADLVSGEIKINDAYEKKFGYTITQHMTTGDAWSSHIHPEDLEAVLTDYRKAILSDKVVWTIQYRFLRADHSVASVASTCIILRHPDGLAYRILGTMHDTSKQKELEEKLKMEILAKEGQIAAAIVEAKELERSDIGRELHDNVNQILGASRLYLDMAGRGGANSIMCLNRSSEYILLAIEEIRKLSKSGSTDILLSLGLREAVETMASDTMQAHAIKIEVSMDDFKEASIKDSFKLNVYRIIQEQLNNTLKHAGASIVRISLHSGPEQLTLLIADDGVGFDTQLLHKGVGLSNIRARAAVFGGVTTIVSAPGEGCSLTVVFPVTVNGMLSGAVV